MSGGVITSPLISHHFQRQPTTYTNQYPYSTFASPTMGTRKRKADDDQLLFADTDFASGPAARQPAIPRTSKRTRTNLTGRPLSLPRLLETLNVTEMRGLLQSICDRHPDLASEIVTTAPRPSVQSALSVLESYQASMRESFPYGDRPSSEYAYNRVRPALMNLLDALRDYTPHFLPPHESQPALSFNFLDGATDIIHSLPNWDSYQHNRHKDEAYEEISKAWALVIREAAKKAGGFQIQYGGWDRKVAGHNEMSGGKMMEAVQELRANSGIETVAPPADIVLNPSQGEPEVMSIRDQLFSGTYGTNQPVQVGPWRQ